MKRPLLFILMLLAVFEANGGNLINQYRFASPGGSPAAFSDAFDRADSDSLGANWTEAAGDADIFSNTYRISTGSFGVVTSIYNTSTGTVTQYVKFSIGSDGQYPWAALRYLNSSSGYYVIQFDGNNGDVYWYYFSDAADTTGDTVGTGTIGTVIANHIVGVTITGTGTSTEVRCWLDPTNLPTSATNWDGDTSPNVTLTDNPSTAADTGTSVGIGGQAGAADSVRLDNFFGGGL